MGHTVSNLPSICSECGTAYHRDQTGGACPECKPRDDGARDVARGNRHQRGYDNTWQRLSKRARKLQPFCSDCGAEDDLTGDHSTESWDRKERGLVIRVRDIDVVCRRCNAERGAARGEKQSNQWRGPRFT